MRQEEEAMYEAKREAARVAKMQNHKHQKAIMGGTRANNFNWFEEENEQGLGTGNEDFEMFLDNVKQRSLAARTRAIASQVWFCESDANGWAIEILFASRYL